MNVTEELLKKYEALRALEHEIAELEKANKKEPSDGLLECFKDMYFVDDDTVYFLCYHNSAWILISSKRCYSYNYDVEWIKGLLQKQARYGTLYHESLQPELKMRFLDSLSARYSTEKEDTEHDKEECEEAINQTIDDLDELEQHRNDLNTAINDIDVIQEKIEKIKNDTKLTPEIILL